MRSDKVHQNFIHLGFESLQWLTDNCRTSLGNLLQRLTVLMGKEIFLIASLNFFCFHLWPLPTVPTPLWAAQLHSLYDLLAGTGRLIFGLPQAVSSGWICPIPSLFTGHMLQIPHHLGGHPTHSMSFPALGVQDFTHMVKWLLHKRG